MATATKRRTKTKAPGVYRSVSGNYEIAYRDSDGKLRFKTIGDDFEEAKTERATIVVKLGRGEMVRSTKQTFKEFADDVLEASNKRPRTREKYEYNLRVHLVPRFGRKRLADIRVNDVARMVAEMQRKGYTGCGRSTRGAARPRSRRCGGRSPLPTPESWAYRLPRR